MNASVPRAATPRVTPTREAPRAAAPPASPSSAPAPRDRVTLSAEAYDAAQETVHGGAIMRQGLTTAAARIPQAAGWLGRAAQWLEPLGRISAPLTVADGGVGLARQAYQGTLSPNNPHTMASGLRVGAGAAFLAGQPEIGFPMLGAALVADHPEAAGRLMEPLNRQPDEDPAMWALRMGGLGA